MGRPDSRSGEPHSRIQSYRPALPSPPIDPELGISWIFSFRPASDWADSISQSADYSVVCPSLYRLAAPRGGSVRAYSHPGLSPS